MTALQLRAALRLLALVTAVLVLATALTGLAVDQASRANAATPAAATPAKPLMTPAQIAKATPAQLLPGGLTVQTDSKASQVVTWLKNKKRAADAAAISQIASQPVTIWLGDWYTQAQLVKVITAQLATAAKTKTTPTFVTYAIPDRDCGGYSAGGLSASAYLAWNTTIAATLRGHHAAVLVEPDSLAMLSNCPSLASKRLPLIKSAVTTLSAAGVATYLDAGNSHWVQPAVIAGRLKAAGIGSARGFFTNVSNFYPLADETAYADKVSALTGGSHYVVDVSRNGQGWKGTWCNPTGAGLGKNPAVANGRTKLDATLWVKTPGASDGTCNSGPSAGTWWNTYALTLVKLRAK